jgi:hypothetical protein
MDNPEIDKNGTKRWRDAAAKLHRRDGPAIERSTGYQAWWQHGKRHRRDGPAVIYEHGHTNWCINGKYFTFERWLDEVKISDEDKVMMKLKYG